MCLSLTRRFGLVMLLVPFVAACGTTPSDDDSASSAVGTVSLATQLQRQGDSATALQAYTRALQQDPANRTATRSAAAILEQMGDISAAAEQYRQSLDYHPRDASLHRDYGRLLLAEEQPAAARDQYKLALDRAPDDLKAQTGLGVAFDYLGDHAAAAGQYQAVLQRDPGNLGTINNLAYSSILTGDYPKAIALLESHLQDAAATPALRQNLALAYGLSGMDADAARIARMDLPPAKVKANLAYYKRQRAERAVTQTPYAELGTYPTEGMAKAQIEKLQPALAPGDLQPVVMPELSTPGGTPRFTVRMMGCTKPDDVKNLCDTLAPLGIPCVAHNDGH